MKAWRAEAFGKPGDVLKLSSIQSEKSRHKLEKQANNSYC